MQKFILIAKAKCCLLFVKRGEEGRGRVSQTSRPSTDAYFCIAVFGQKRLLFLHLKTIKADGKLLYSGSRTLASLCRYKDNLLKKPFVGKSDSSLLDIMLRGTLRKKKKYLK